MAAIALSLSTMPSLTALLSEPYRLLFPIGLLQLIAALALWPIAAAMGWQSYPGALHVGLAVHGLLACFVVGFLATMAPNMLQAGRPEPFWVSGFVIAALGGAAALVAGSTTWAAAMLALSFLMLLAFALRCAVGAKRAPPPQMAVIAVAVLAGTGAAILGLLAQLGMPLPAWLRIFAADLRQQGMLVLLVAGIGGLLLPRLAVIGRPDPACMAPASSPRRMLVLALLALAIVASYGVQAVVISGGNLGSTLDRGLRVLRALLLAVLVWPVITLPRGRLPTWLRSAQVAVLSVVLGVLMPAVDPAQALAWHHLIFISGFLWLTLLIAARVVTAHSGRSAVLDQDRWPLWVIGILVLLAVSCRIGAGYVSETYLLHLVLAALFLLPALLLWAFRYGPLLWATPGFPPQAARSKPLH